MNKRFSFFNGEAALWTRLLGRRYRGQIDTLLDDVAPDAELTLDLQGIDAFDYSFADEVFGSLSASNAVREPRRFLVLEHLSENARYNLERILGQQGLAMIERTGDGSRRLIGKVPVADAETFAVLAAATEGLSAMELSAQLGIQLTAANERLKGLYRRGLIARRQEASAAGRDQFRYWTVR